MMVRPLMSGSCTATTPRATSEIPLVQVLIVMQFSDSAVAIFSKVSLISIIFSLDYSWRSW